MATPRVFSPPARVASPDKKGIISEQDINANRIRISKVKITPGIYVNPISSGQTKAGELFKEKISNIDQEIRKFNKQVDSPTGENKRRLVSQVGKGNIRTMAEVVQQPC